MVASVDPVRFVLFVLWGVASSAVWAAGLRLSYRAWKRYGDRRSRRELMRDTALAITAVASTLAVLGVLFGEQGGTPRSVALAVALGAFLGAGIIYWTMRRAEEKGDA